MNSRFYYRMTYKGDGTSTPVTIDAPFVTNLSAKVRQVATLVVLADDEGRSPQGLYQWVIDRWRLALPQVDISLGVVVGYDIDVYYNLQAPVTITAEGARIFRNGAPFNGTTLTTDGHFVWAVMIPANGTGTGNVRSVNGVTPDGNGNVQIDIANIPGLEEALAEAGQVKTVNGVQPDINGNVQIDIADINNLQTLLDSKVSSVNGIMPINGELTLVAIDVGALSTDLLGQPNGVASLDINGKVPTAQLPASVLGALKYQGGYDASTNTPPLPTPGPDNVGFYWVTTVAGTQQGKDLQVGDWIVSNGTTYDEIDNQNTVSSVNGKIGVVVIGISDIAGLQAALDSSVKTVNGATPDSSGNAVVPFATDTVAGTVSVPTAGGLVVNDGELTLSQSIVDAIGFTPTHVVYVASNGNPTTGTGTRSNPFTTIAAAVEAAPSGSIIAILSPGTYPDTLELGSKSLAIVAPPIAGNAIDVWITGYMQLDGAQPVSVVNLGINYTGSGASLRVTQVGNTQGFRIANLVIQSSSAAQAIQIDETGGSWTGSLIFDNLYTNDGKISIDGGYTIFRGVPQDSASIVEMTAGVAEVYDVWHWARVVHTGGQLYLTNARSLGTATNVSAIESTADDEDGNILFLKNVSTWIDPTTQSYINKTGTCPYVVDGVTRNLVNDVWTGDDTLQKADYDLDTLVSRAGVNYVGDIAATLTTHLAGIDAALGIAQGAITVLQSDVSTLQGDVSDLQTEVAGKVGPLTSAGGTSLISNGTTGVLKGLNQGSGISLSSDGNTVTVAATGVATLSSVTGTDVVSLVNNSAGQLVGLLAGTGINFSLNSGILTVNSTGGGGVTSFNGLTGAVALVEGSGVTLTPSGNQITISADPVAAGVESINGQGGALTVQGDGSTIAVDTATGTLTLSYIGTPGGVTSINTIQGAVNVLGDGENIQVTNDGQNITVTYIGSGGGGGGVTSLNGLINALNLVAGSSIISIVPDAVSGNITIDSSALTTIQDTAISTPGAAQLVADSGTNGTALIKQLIGGANIVLTQSTDSVTLDVLSGGGTVKSINGIEPTDPAVGDVHLDPADVGAVARIGDTMEGPLDMNGNAIKNVPDAVDPQDPLTMSFLNSGNVVIDAGTF